MSANSENKRGVIFDMDGVISDTQNLHAQVESEFLRSLNIEIHPDEITVRFAGVGDNEMFATIFADHGVDHPIEQMIEEKWLHMSRMVDKLGISAVPCAIELIETLYNDNFILAIASGSPRVFIDRVVQSLSLQRYFSAMVSSEEVQYGKPAPDVFLEAAKRANVSPSRCVIIEDGISGMKAAARANIPCIGLVADTSKEYPASIAVTSLKDVTIELITQLQESQARVSVRRKAYCRDSDECLNL